MNLFHLCILSRMNPYLRHNCYLANKGKNPDGLSSLPRILSTANFKVIAHYCRPWQRSPTLTLKNSTTWTETEAGDNSGVVLLRYFTSVLYTCSIIIKFYWVCAYSQIDMSSRRDKRNSALHSTHNIKRSLYKKKDLCKKKKKKKKGINQGQVFVPHTKSGQLLKAGLSSGHYFQQTVQIQHIITNMTWSSSNLNKFCTMCPALTSLKIRHTEYIERLQMYEN